MIANRADVGIRAYNGPRPHQEGTRSGGIR